MSIYGPHILVFGAGPTHTAEHVITALRAGYRVIDTAPSPHGDETQVGKGIKQFLASTEPDFSVSRHDIFIQTRLHISDQHDCAGQHKLDASCTSDHTAAMVAASLEVSLNKLGTDYVDCLLLHVPNTTCLERISDIWDAMQRLVPHKTRSLGFADARLEALIHLQMHSSIMPTIVMNRFCLHVNLPSSYDHSVRAFCQKHRITYLAVSVLKYNGHLLRHRIITRMAQDEGVSAVVCLYALITSLGVSTDASAEDLDLTTSLVHVVTGSHQHDRIIQNVTDLPKLRLASDLVGVFDRILCAFSTAIKDAGRGGDETTSNTHM